MNSYEHFANVINWDYWTTAFDMVDFEDTYQGFWRHPLMLNEKSARALTPLKFEVGTMQYLFHVYMTWRTMRGQARFHAVSEEKATRYLSGTPGYIRGAELFEKHGGGRFLELPKGCVTFNGSEKPGRYPATGMYVTIHKGDAPNIVDLRLLMTGSENMPPKTIWDEAYFFVNFRLNRSEAVWPQILDQIAKVVRDESYVSQRGHLNTPYFLPAARIALNFLFDESPESHQGRSE